MRLYLLADVDNAFLTTPDGWFLSFPRSAPTVPPIFDIDVTEFPSTATLGETELVVAGTDLQLRLTLTIDGEPVDTTAAEAISCTCRPLQARDAITKTLGDGVTAGQGGDTSKLLIAFAEADTAALAGGAMLEVLVTDADDVTICPLRALLYITPHV
jgi:hypothetical protein